MDSITPATAMVGASAWFGNKLLGPTADAIGKDLKRLYQAGRDRIVANAMKKTPNLDVPGRTNLRVTRDVLWNGAFSDDEICADYFGGILAASRSADGKDDSGVFYTDIVKSLSSKQLLLHYTIYRAFNSLSLHNDGPKDLDSLSRKIFEPYNKVFFDCGNLEQFQKAELLPCLWALDSKKLILEFAVEKHTLNCGIVGTEPTINYLMARPSILGIQLFAMAHNKLEQWQKFLSTDFGDFAGIGLPEKYANSLDGLMKLRTTSKS